MTNDSKEVQKNEDVLAMVATVTKQLADRQDKTDAVLKEISESVKKLTDSNPVAHGPDLEKIPKVQDAQEAGAKTEATNAYGQSRQASIVNSGNPKSSTDESGLSQETNKSAPVKKEDKEHDEEHVEKHVQKEAVKKAEKDEHEDEHEEKHVEKHIQKSSEKSMKKVYNGVEYVKVDAIRPKIFDKQFTGTQPTAYEILKTLEGGWGGKYTDAGKAFEEFYLKLSRGEFGLGNPGEFA